MDTKIFIGFPLNALSKEELAESVHTLLITQKEGQEYLGLRSESSTVTFEDIKALKEEIIHQLEPLAPSVSELQIFPELLLG